MGALAGKTYEVQVDQGDGRWVVVELFDTRNISIEKARMLLESGKYAAAKVIAESDRTGVEVIFEENNKNFSGKPITIVPIDSAPLCTAFPDYFSLESRRTIGRVLRHHLDHHTLSALEIMFDPSMIRMLENSDTLFPQFIQQIAGAQTRGTDIKPADRIDELYSITARMRETAAKAAADITGYEIIKEKGINALITRMNGSYDDDEAFYYILQAFARYLHDGGDWNSKIELLCNLSINDLTDEAVALLDDAMAEILDGAAAIQELLGGQADLATAIRTLIKLTQGRASISSNALSCIENVNDIMLQRDLTNTKQIILERVALHLNGIKKLTRENPEEEREAFNLIVRDLTDVSGILGGSKMCGGVIQRARITFSKDGEDLTFPDAMERIINLLPHRAARIGFLAELSFSPVSEEYRALVLSELSKIIRQLSSLEDLVSSGSPRAIMRQAVDGLKKRLTSDDIPKEWRETLGETFEALISKQSKDNGADASTGSKTPPFEQKTGYQAKKITDEEFVSMLTEKPIPRDVQKGETLFEEGDIGAEAYLIIEGEIEVFKRVGNQEHVIATLKKGEIVGEMSLIDNQPRMASARIMDDTKLLVISQESLNMRLDRLQQEDRVMRRLMDTLVGRLRGEAQAGP